MRHFKTLNHFISFPANLPCDSTHEDEGSYYSPYYPDTYVNDQTCKTLFKIPDNSDFNGSVVFFFADFNLEESSDCSHDSLTIYDGDSDESPVLGTYCGTEAPSFVASTGSNATAVFRTDSTNTSTGYKFHIEFKKGISSSRRWWTWPQNTLLANRTQWRGSFKCRKQAVCVSMSSSSLNILNISLRLQ